MRAAVLLVPTLLGTSVAQAAEPAPYLDDRSTPEAVLRSLYNAVDRHEIVRAWSYFRDTPERPSFDSFRRGYEKTAAVRVAIGAPAAEGGMSQIHWRVPVAIEASDETGARTVFSGCYTLHQTQPEVQAEPPFQPIEILGGELRPSDRPFETATGACPAVGSP
ncbi:hypothetical protein [Aureimonas sp. AU4]|uniref:hypothetical protein n=1 Tax=Aureimonas sp. AU4 TaxID=1638163 RepID=UPI0007060CC7|nr:hypothetical protein [Aureimonas sp. AU4]BAT30336.1 hypothetical protein [Aureimonas sp. AU4]